MVSLRNFFHAHDTLMSIMLSLFNRIFDNGVLSDCWNSAHIVPIYKKGDVNEPINYRGISLLDTLGKIFTSVINRRLTYFTNIYNCGNESQAGFREEYSTIDKACVLQTFICKSLSRKRDKLFVAFIDFQTAFDSVRRDKLWHSLSAVGLKGKLLKVTKGLYDNVTACVRWWKYT